MPKIKTPLNIIYIPENSIFTNSNYLRLWSAQIFSQTGVHILNFVLGVSVYNLTKSTQAVSLLVISYGAAAFIFSAFAGVFVDQMDKKKILIFTLLSRFFLVLALLTATESLIYTAILAFLFNSVTQFFFPAEGAVIPLIVEKENRMVANSLYTLSFYGTQIVGYLGAGLLLEKLGAESTILFIAILFILASAMVYYTNIPDIVITDKKPLKEIIRTAWLELKKGLEYIKENDEVKEPLYYIGFTQIAIGLFFVLLPAYGVEVLGLKAEETSFYLIAPLAIGIIAGALTVNTINKKISKDKIVNLGIILAFLGFTMLAITRRIPIDKVKHVTSQLNTIQSAFPNEINKFLGVDTLLFAMVSMMVIGVANAYVLIVNNTYIQDRTTEKMRGRVYGTLQTIAIMCSVIPVLAIGFFADRIGINPVIFVVGILIVLFHIVIRYKYGKPIL